MLKLLSTAKNVVSKREMFLGFLRLRMFNAVPFVVIKISYRYLYSSSVSSRCPIINGIQCEI